MLDPSSPDKDKKRLIQSVGFQFPSRALLHQWGEGDSLNCPFCHDRESLGHIQSRCKSLEKPHIVADHMIWREILLQLLSLSGNEGMNINGSFPRQFLQSNTRRSSSAKYSTILASSPLTLLWRARSWGSSPSAPLSRCRYVDLEIWHGPWEITVLVRTKKGIVVTQAQFPFTDVLVAPSPPSRACGGGVPLVHLSRDSS